MERYDNMAIRHEAVSCAEANQSVVGLELCFRFFSPDPFICLPLASSLLSQEIRNRCTHAPVFLHYAATRSIVLHKALFAGLNACTRARALVLYARETVSSSKNILLAYIRFVCIW